MMVREQRKKTELSMELNNMNIRLFGVANDSIVDGPGIRYAVFVQGCPHNCEDCHNPKSHDFSGGYLKDIDELVCEIKSNPLLDGVTFSGGEPFCSAKELVALADKLCMHVVCYTGYLFEDLINGANDENCWLELLKKVELLIDGPFIKEQKSYDLMFKGSANQRIIDVKKSLSQNKTIIAEL